VRFHDQFFLLIELQTQFELVGVGAGLFYQASSADMAEWRRAIQALRKPNPGCCCCVVKPLRRIRLDLLERLFEGAPFKRESLSCMVVLEIVE